MMLVTYRRAVDFVPLSKHLCPIYRKILLTIGVGIVHLGLRGWPCAGPALSCLAGLAFERIADTLFSEYSHCIILQC